MKELLWLLFVCLLAGEENSYAAAADIAVTDHTLTSSSTDILKPVRTADILILLFLFVTFASIVFVVIVSIRNSRNPGRSDESPLKVRIQIEAVSPEYETLVRDKRPSDDDVAIYTELELTQRPTPSNNDIYANVQPTKEAVDMDENVIYVDPREL